MNHTYCNEATKETKALGMKTCPYRINSTTNKHGFCTLKYSAQPQTEEATWRAIKASGISYICYANPWRS
jgi:hypothetical protein